MAAETITKSRQAVTLWVVLLVVITTAVFANSLRGGFVSDDWPVIRDNLNHLTMANIPAYFTSGVWSNTNTSLKDAFLYRPMFLTAMALDARFWGADPFGYHLLNLVLHTVNVLLLFCCIRVLAPESGSEGAFLASLLFAVHPVHSESVSWISGFTDIEVTFFLLAAFLAYLRGTGSGSALWFSLSVLSFAAALLTKEVAVLFPAILFLYHVISGEKTRVWRFFVFLALLAGYFWLRHSVLGASAGGGSFYFTKVGTFGRFSLKYLSLLVFPWPLDFYFRMPKGGITGPWGVISGMLLLILLVWKLPAAVRERRLPYLFGLAWFVLTLLPALALAFYINPTFALRFLYLPSVGLSLLVAWLYSCLAGSRRKAFVSALIAVVLVFSAMSVQANGKWLNDGTFYSSAIRANPDDSGAYFGLGRHYERRREYDEAIRFYRMAAQRSEGDSRLTIMENMAALFGMSNQPDKSTAILLDVLKQSPGRSSAWVGLGNNAFAEMNYKRAIRMYRQALMLDPANQEAGYDLSLACGKAGDAGSTDCYMPAAGSLKRP